MRGKIVIALLFILVIFSGCVGDSSESAQTSLLAVWTSNGIDISETSLAAIDIALLDSETISSLKAGISSVDVSGTDKCTKSLKTLFIQYVDYLSYKQELASNSAELDAITPDNYCSDGLTIGENAVFKIESLKASAEVLSSSIASFSSSCPEQATALNISSDVPAVALLEESLSTAQEGLQEMKDLCSEPVSPEFDIEEPEEIEPFETVTDTEEPVEVDE